MKKNRKTYAPLQMKNQGCDNCFLKEVTSFPLTSDFDHLDLHITKKLANGTFHLVDDFPNEKSKEVNYTKYACTICKTKWYLSEPDHAWRGFFLKEPNAKVKMARDSYTHKAENIGCLMAIVAIAFFIFCLLTL